MKTSAVVTHSIDLPTKIFCFELSPHEWSQNLICIAVSKKLVLGRVKCPEESETDSFEWEEMKQFYHENRCEAISFAPDTSLSVIPNVVKICAAGSDFRLRIYRSDIQSYNNVQELKEVHQSYINAIAWEPDCEYLASVSDDHSCVIWNARENFESFTTFCLNSAGVSVKWHPDDPGKVLVAEKSGLIHLYNAKSQQSVMSLESPKIPLTSADWAPSNHFYISCLAGGDVIIWDLSKSRQLPARPIETREIHEDGGRIVRFSPNNEILTASIGRPDITLKVLNSKTTLPQIEASLRLYCGLCWHYRLPYIVAGYDRKLNFWKVQLK